MLSYDGLLKQKHKILNLDDAEDDHLIIAIWNFEKQNYYLKNAKR